MTLQHVIKINSRVEPIKARYTDIIKLESGSTLHIPAGCKHFAKEVFRDTTGRFAARFSFLF